MGFPKEFSDLIIKYHGPINCNIFDKFFYHQFVSQTKEYYSIKSRLWINEKRMSSAQYFRNCQHIIEIETNNLKKWGINGNNFIIKDEKNQEMRDQWTSIQFIIQHELYRYDRIQKLIKYNKETQFRKDFVIDLFESMLFFFNEYSEDNKLFENEVQTLFHSYLREPLFDEIAEIYQYFFSIFSSKSVLQSSKMYIIKIFQKLIGSKIHFICSNLIKLWNHNLKKLADGLEKKMDFIVAASHLNDFCNYIEDIQ